MISISAACRYSRIVRHALGLMVLLGSCTSVPVPTVTIAVSILPSEQEPYRQLLNRFTDSTGIRVTLIAQQYQQIRNALEAEAIAGRGELDVVELDVHLLGSVRDQMRRLDTLVGTLSELKADASPGALLPGQDFQGEHAFLPHRLNWQAMVYNSNELPSPPDTWEQLFEVAHSRPGSIGLKAARYEGMICDLFPFLWQAGGDPLQPTAPGTLEALHFLERLAPFLNPAASSYRENSILQAQEHGEILIHFNWPFVVPLLREKGLLGSQIRIAPLPSGPAGRATILGGGYLGIPRTAPHAKQAAKLIDFLVSRDAQAQLSRNLGWFPVRESAWEALHEMEPQLEAYLQMRGEVRARPSLPNYDRLSALWQEAFSRILFDGGSPDRVADDLAVQIRQLSSAGP